MPVWICVIVAAAALAVGVKVGFILGFRNGRSIAADEVFEWAVREGRQIRAERERRDLTIRD